MLGILRLNVSLTRASFSFFLSLHSVYYSISKLYSIFFYFYNSLFLHFAFAQVSVESHFKSIVTKRKKEYSNFEKIVFLEAFRL